ncbi:MAG: ATP-dependent DNA helicase [Proteobacteria bacterium]|nr:ATP-dependent DNA helicase [Pseudomonadota bacterium]MBU1059650.1 ATP-dependent DNA helicase [Pseudomonadota bacterium]
MKEIFAAGGKLAAGLSGFEPREGQLQMAEAIAAVLEEGGRRTDGKAAVLLVEAETGIGKTLAYLAPALLSGQRVVISTATITLQDQIIKKEIPLLEKVLGVDIPVLCIKGRQNYLCHYRWFQYRSTPQTSLLDDREGDKIERWLETTVTGDRAELSWLADRSPLWPKISAQSNQCLGSDCPEFALCYVNRLRKLAGSVRLLVVNHHLFFSDLSLRQAGFGEILPRYQAVIFDEAHHLENVASNFFGKHFSQYQLLDLLGDIERQAESALASSAFAAIVGYGRGLKQRLDGFAALFPALRGRYPLIPLQENTERWQEEVANLGTGLGQLSQRCQELAVQGEVWNLFAARADELQANFLHIAGTEEMHESGFIHWYERRERTISLSATPVKVAAELEKSLYSSVQSCIMTSATLTTGGDFSYVQQRLGIDSSCETLRFHSPFDYSRRTLLYVPETGFPDPTAKDYSHSLCQRLYELLTISRGRALVLFTSFKAMDMVADFLEDRLDYPVLVQGNASRQALLNQFRDTTDSVLLAVASFWEGVDVAGDSLSCVLIDKLPFEVPSDPVIQSRMKAIEEEGGKPFFQFQVPRAILTLRQGVGRLMRSTNDRGVIGIMDIRLYTKGYGHMFRASLPPSPVVRTLTEVEKFFATD